MTQEVLKLALEALEVLGWQPTEEAMDYRDNAITAIKEALAQPEQEPVAWMSEHRFDELRKGFTVMTTLTKQRVFEDDVAIYTTPPQRKPLTDEEIEDLYFDKFSMSELKAFARAIEAAHGIKENT